ncbi:hypothetical protein ACEWY4_004063 [Coilia grayii]|uniref:C-type lectin domain-containing protein n=1 Tax=Coilia grayii TaxID=363190 RepID=A0ABD1KKG1_9TELE
MLVNVRRIDRDLEGSRPFTQQVCRRLTPGAATHLPLIGQQMLLGSERSLELLSPPVLPTQRGWVSPQPSAPWAQRLERVTFVNMEMIIPTLALLALSVPASGRWDTEQCSSNKSFICYSEDNNLLNYTDEPKTWSEAQDYCRKKFTDLVSIRSEEENDKVHKTQVNTGSSWIGLFGDKWDWSDGGRSGYRNWDRSEAVGPVGALISGKWMQLNNSTVKPSFCYKAHIHISDYRMTWEQSLNYCRKCNGLLTIETLKEQRVVEAFLRRHGVSEPVWVGLKRGGLLGYSMWVDGDRVRWSHTEYCKKTHVYGPLKFTEHHRWWTDINCQFRLRALCFQPSPNDKHCLQNTSKGAF